MQEIREHWDNIYKTKDHKLVGWYQEYPAISLELLSKINAEHAQSIIDVGCGASVLVDNLLLQGFYDITLLDLSEEALSSIKSRLVDNGNIPQYFAKDITAKLEFSHQFNIWHDRAVFHFLTKKEDRLAYMDNLAHYLSSDGHAIIGTFSLNGPNSCSGLNVVQYDEQKFKSELPQNFEVIETVISTHIMPSGNEQEYIYFIIKHKLIN
ncbi:class I SAM-dependent methyltransferase [Sulfurovum sp. zt1-1]|uniref:Class I SAM-dependent methyltransferase n=1 Tax=Sulfurovum zhangzhouensis TaxID=3019067 RepID=A0ABT7QV69_9BACT|nr:class I SAM-dependent methyltransferase [Sulfurovum zhangzhouensis]MDM5270737.1 class I SAM-dependent methyltransferase [Sulfurovum zhangzhouensis]